ncbi:MAG: hypothetical protein ACI8RP_001612 [Urechidicola sp.]|jgi:hypothetical protein
MKITSGDYEVLYSGTVIGIINNPIEFQFTKKEGSIKIIIVFKSDHSLKDSLTELNVVDEKTLEMVLINMDDVGTGNTETMHLGTIQNRNLYINYRVYSIPQLSKTIHYTFYLGEEVANDN